MEGLKRGDIWTAEPPGHAKPRPVLVFSIDPINDLCPEVIVVPVTTKPGPLRVPFEQPPSMTGLEKASFAKCESVGGLHKSRLKKKIGSLPAAEMAPFENGVLRVLGLDRPAY